MPFSEGEPPPPPTTLPARSLRSLSPHFGPLLANLGCTTVTCIAKGRRAHVPPIDWNKRNFKRVEYGIGLYATSHNNYPIPLIMAFHVQENAVFIHKFSKSLLSVNPLPHPPPAWSLRSPSLPSPLLTNPGYTLCHWHIAKGHKPPCPPLIKNERNATREGILVYAILLLPSNGI